MATKKPRTHYMFKKETGKVLVKKPGDIEGQAFKLDTLDDCDVLLIDHFGCVNIDYLSNCRVFIGPTSDSVFIRDSHNCEFTVACGQLRTRNVDHCVINLYAKTDPVIEDTFAVRFRPWNGACPLMDELVEKAGLDGLNLWKNIFDFTPSKPELPEPHYVFDSQNWKEWVVDLDGEFGDPINALLPTDSDLDYEDEDARPVDDGVWRVTSGSGDEEDGSPPQHNDEDEYHDENEDSFEIESGPFRGSGSGGGGPGGGMGRGPSGEHTRAGPPLQGDFESSFEEEGEHDEADHRAGAHDYSLAHDERAQEDDGYEEDDYAVPLRFALKYSPPLIALEFRVGDRVRTRRMPVRGLTATSNPATVTKALITAHVDILHPASVKVTQVEKLVRKLVLNIGKADAAKAPLAPLAGPSSAFFNQNFNALGDEELKAVKEVMDVAFVSNQIKKDDPNFVYDKKIEFEPPTEVCAWDLSDDEI